MIRYGAFWNWMFEILYRNFLLLEIALNGLSFNSFCYLVFKTDSILVYLISTYDIKGYFIWSYIHTYYLLLFLIYSIGLHFIYVYFHSLYVSPMVSLFPCINWFIDDDSMCIGITITFCEIDVVRWLKTCRLLKYSKMNQSKIGERLKTEKDPMNTSSCEMLFKFLAITQEIANSGWWIWIYNILYPNEGKSNKCFMNEKLFVK